MGTQVFGKSVPKTSTLLRTSSQGVKMSLFGRRAMGVDFSAALHIAPKGQRVLFTYVTIHNAWSVFFT